MWTAPNAKVIQLLDIRVFCRTRSNINVNHSVDTSFCYHRPLVNLAKLQSRLPFTIIRPPPLARRMVTPTFLLQNQGPVRPTVPPITVPPALNCQANPPEVLHSSGIPFRRRSCRPPGRQPVSAIRKDPVASTFGAPVINPTSETTIQ